MERAAITSTMNRRIRDFNATSREICFMRDENTNDTKIVDDKKFIENQQEKRKDSHAETTSTEDMNIKVGSNVFIKNDKSKLKQRSMHRVVDRYTKDNEEWATIQKHESQFRAKRYEMKLAELILIPGQATTNQEKDPIEEDMTRTKFTPENDTILPNVMKTKVKKETTIYRAPGDYEKLMEMIQFDEEMQIVAYQPGMNNEETSDAESSSMDPTSTSGTLTPANSDYDASMDTSADSTPNTPTNSRHTPIPNQEQPLEAEDLRNALQNAITNMQDFNRAHPLGPPRRSGRRQVKTKYYHDEVWPKRR